MDCDWLWLPRWSKGSLVQTIVADPSTRRPSIYEHGVNKNIQTQGQSMTFSASVSLILMQHSERRISTPENCFNEHWMTLPLSTCSVLYKGHKDGATHDKIPVFRTTCFYFVTFVTSKVLKLKNSWNESFALVLIKCSVLRIPHVPCRLRTSQ